MVAITMTYASVLGALMALLSIRIPIRRGRLDVPLGDGGDEALATRIRAFGNFIEYVPMIVLMMALVEASNGSAVVLHLAGGALVAARVVHAVAYRARGSLDLPQKIGRGLGAFTTWSVLVGLSVYSWMLR